MVRAGHTQPLFRVSAISFLLHEPYRVCTQVLPCIRAASDPDSAPFLSADLMLGTLLSAS